MKLYDVSQIDFPLTHAVQQNLSIVALKTEPSIMYWQVEQVI